MVSHLRGWPETVIKRLALVPRRGGVTCRRRNGERVARGPPSPAGSVEDGGTSHPMTPGSVGEKGWHRRAWEASFVILVAQRSPARAIYRVRRRSARSGRAVGRGCSARNGGRVLKWGPRHPSTSARPSSRRWRSRCIASRGPKSGVHFSRPMIARGSLVTPCGTGRTPRRRLMTPRGGLVTPCGSERTSRGPLEARRGRGMAAARRRRPPRPRLAVLASPSGNRTMQLVMAAGRGWEG